MTTDVNAWFRPILNWAIALLWAVALLWGAVLPAAVNAQTANVGYVLSVLASGATGTASVAADSAKNIYFTETAGGGQLIKATPSTTGTYTLSTIGTGLGTNLTGIAVDSTGNVYVLDAGDNRIWELPAPGYAPSVIVSTGLNHPGGIALDGSGNIYVADTGSNRVLKLAAPTYTATSIGTTINAPEGVAVDAAGNVYVANTGAVATANRVVKETLSGGSYSETAVPAVAAWLAPSAIAVDSTGNLYVADDGQVVKETVSGTTYTPSVDVPAGPLGASFRAAVDSSGNVFVADTANNRVLEFFASADIGSVPLQTVSGPLIYSFTFTASTAVSSYQILTQGVAGLDFAAAGTQQSNVCVAQTYAIGSSCTVTVTFSPKYAGLRSGAIVLYGAAGAALVTGYIQGTGVGPQLVFRPGAQTVITNANLYQPKNIALDGNLSVYIANNEFCTINKYNPGSLSPANVLSVGTPLNAAGGCSTSVGSPGTPRGVWVDGAGNIYTVNSDNTNIMKIVRLSGGSYAAAVQLSPGGPFAAMVTPSQVIIDGTGSLYVSDSGNGRVLKATLSANGTYTGNGKVACSSAPASAHNFWGLGVDSAGNIYVADAMAKTVLKCAIQPGGTYSAPAVIASGLLGPYGMTIDGAGDLYVADTDNTTSAGNRIVELLPNSDGTVYTQSLVSLSSVNNLRGVAVDQQGNLYITDQIVNSTKNDNTVGKALTLAISGPPASLTFNPTYVGTTSSDSPQLVTLQNVGNQALNFPVPTTGNNPSIADNFSLGTATNACPVVAAGSGAVGTLAPATVCDLYVNFTPIADTGEGVDTGTLVITDNNLLLVPPSVITVKLSGVGLLITIMPSSLPDWTAGVPYPTKTLTASGTTGPYTFKVISGSLPPGLSLSASGVLSGTPTTNGTYNFTVQATDSTPNTTGGPYTATIAYQIVISATPTLSWANPGDITYGTPLSSTQLDALISDPSITGEYVYSPKAGTVLPAGTAQTLSVKFTATDGTVYTATVKIDVNPASLTVTANNQTRPYGATEPGLTYSITGYVNDDNSSVITGTPTLSTMDTPTSPVGNYPIQISGSLVASNYDFVYVPGVLIITQAVPGTNPGNSKVTLTVNPASVMYGNTATMTAAISPAGATGTVTFTATPSGGGTPIPLGTSSVDSTGKAVFPESTLSVGDYTIVAQYNGDTNIAPTTSNTAPLTVTKRTNPSGGPALIVTVNDASRTTTQENPQFSYTVAGDLVNNDSYNTAVTGTAVYATAAGVLPGTFTITVSSGLSSTNYLLGYEPGNLVVSLTPTTTTLTASPSSPQYGDPVTLTATVAPSGATGTVSFYADGVYLGQGNVSGGVATLVTSTLNAGTHTITAIYNGDASYASSESAPATLTIAKKTAPDGTSAALTITAQNASREFATADPQFQYVVTGTLVNNDSYATAVTGVPAYSVADTPTSPVGSTFPITVSNLVSQNYVVAFVPGTLSIVTSPTTTALTTSTTSPQYGDPVILTASVVPAGATGTVVFSSGATVIGTGVLFNGIALLTTSSLNAGTYVITANYEGDGNYGASTSPPVTVVVAKKTAPDGTSAALTITVQDASRQYGQGNPAFAYAVTGSLVGSDTYATAVTGVPVYATTGTVTAPVGSYPITLTGGLNSANYVIAFVNGTLTVNKGTASITVISSLNPSTYQAAVTFTAQVSAGATGTVNFMDGTTVLGTGTISGTTATFTTSTLTVGTHPVTAVYSGDANYSGVTSTVLSQVVDKATPGQNGIAAVTVASSQNPATIGTPVTFTATVPAGATGTITFMNGTTALGTSTITGTTATLTTSTLIVGVYPITAVYSGDANFNGATSAVLNQVVIPKPSSIIVTPSSTTPPPDTPDTLIANVPTGATGTVTFYDGTTVIGTATVANGVATITVTLSPGTHTITANYGGDSTFTFSISPPVTITVASPADFSVASNTPRQLIPPGASATYNILINSVTAPFTSVVTLSASDLPPGATYTYTPATVTPGTAGATSSFVVSVPAVVASRSQMRSRAHTVMPAALALLLMPLMWLKRNRSGTPRLLLWMLMALTTLGAITGCGVGGYFSQTEQTYTITVTGTSGTLVHSTTVTLTVE